MSSNKPTNKKRIRKRGATIWKTFKSYFLRNQLVIRYGYILYKLLWSAARVTFIFRVLVEVSTKVYLIVLTLDVLSAGIGAYFTGRATLSFVKSEVRKFKYFVFLIGLNFVIFRAAILKAIDKVDQEFLILGLLYVIVSGAILLYYSNDQVKKIKKKAFDETVDSTVL